MRDVSSTMQFDRLWDYYYMLSECFFLEEQEGAALGTVESLSA